VTYIASKLIPYSFRENDEASNRRQLYHEFCKEEDLPENFKSIPDTIHVTEEYIVNERYEYYKLRVASDGVSCSRLQYLTSLCFSFLSGMLLFTTTMTPTDQPVKAVVCFCHGYTDSVSFSKRIEFQRLVEQGIAFVALEYEGHGRSDGTIGLISDWERLIDDVSSFYEEVATKRFLGKPTFLMGESMG
jgi:hypothetical protein